ncbi:MAG: hypothetical protein CVU39_04315 [Chloroflexi bacterium HGW-Chloroflexi-10]|nr:MAG: hypothetical protein CVU39_04315 [Chloroflexi bacterium HGW-Chloroflexi-10]
MAEKRWHSVKRQRCEHAGCEVDLEFQVVLPPEYLPEQPARVVGHRCSQGMQCSMFTQPSCTWAGTNPGYDPFTDPE